MAKLGRNENMTIEVLAKVCDALKVDIGDIMEVLPKESGEGDEKQEASNKE